MVNMFENPGDKLKYVKMGKCLGRAGILEEQGCPTEPLSRPGGLEHPTLVQSETGPENVPRRVLGVRFTSFLNLSIN